MARPAPTMSALDRSLLERLRCRVNLRMLKGIPQKNGLWGQALGSKGAAGEGEGISRAAGRRSLPQVPAARAPWLTVSGTVTGTHARRRNPRRRQKKNAQTTECTTCMETREVWQLVASLNSGRFEQRDVEQPPQHPGPIRHCRATVR